MSDLDLADGLRLLDAASTADHFGHLEHLAFAWSVLDEAADLAEATRVVTQTIRHAATAAGNPGRYHTTVTVFWVRALAHLRDTNPEVTTLKEAIAVWPDLTDADLPSRHWSDLSTEESRVGWVEPDLAPIP